MKIAYISGVKFGLDVLNSVLENNWDVSIILSYSESKKKNVQ